MHNLIRTPSISPKETMEVSLPVSPTSVSPDPQGKSKPLTPRLVIHFDHSYPSDVHQTDPADQTSKTSAGRPFHGLDPVRRRRLVVQRLPGGGARRGRQQLGRFHRPLWLLAARPGAGGPAARRKGGTTPSPIRSSAEPRNAVSP
jgi:hypothetical protein